MKIEAMEIHNYKAFQNVRLDKLGTMVVFLGGNGAGKTTFLDIFSFIKACLTDNVRSALKARGGYDEVQSRDAVGDIQFFVQFRLPSDGLFYTYRLQIGKNEKNEPAVIFESLYIDAEKNKMSVFIREGTFIVCNKLLKENMINITDEDIPDYKISDEHLLALNLIGQMTEYPVAVEFRKYVESWFISDFQIDRMRSTQDMAYNENLNSKGDNIANVAQYLFNQYPDRFNEILKKMQEKIPGVDKVEAKTTEEGNILLRFKDSRFKDPFASRYVSDGTIKMFAYMVMLAEPNPRKLLCIEEPENQLYPNLLEILAEEFREYAEQGGQVFVSSHSPEFVNALEPQELFFIKKQENGYSQINSIVKEEKVLSLYKEGDKLGYLWKEGLLEVKI